MEFMIVLLNKIMQETQTVHGFPPMQILGRSKEKEKNIQMLRKDAKRNTKSPKDAGGVGADLMGPVDEMHYGKLAQ